MIISLSGLKGSGKDTVADVLINKFNFKRLSLADPLKELCSSVFNLPINTFHDVALKDALFEKPIILNSEHLAQLSFDLNELGYSVNPNLFSDFKGVALESPRHILVFIGTDLCRNLVRATIWVDILRDRLQRAESAIVVTDARFQNERDLLKSLGGIKIWVDRPEATRKFDPNSAHISEVDQLSDSYDVTIINDRSISFLQESVCLWYTLKHGTR